MREIKEIKEERHLERSELTLRSESRGQIYLYYAEPRGGRPKVKDLYSGRLTE